VTPVCDGHDPHPPTHSPRFIVRPCSRLCHPTYTALEKKLEAENTAVGQNKEAIRTLEAKVMELQQDQESESMGKGQAQKDLAQVSATSKGWAWV
jgi:hypothetical protein